MKNLLLSLPKLLKKKEIYFLICFAGSLLIILFDQISKFYIIKNFALYDKIDIINGMLTITHVHNFGAAWSIFTGWLILLIVFAIIVLILIVLFFKQLTNNYFERNIAIFLVVAGIVGNTIDRVWYGYVVDFIFVHYYDTWTYPVFNIADVSICCGVGIFMLSSMLRSEKNKKNSL